MTAFTLKTARVPSGLGVRWLACWLLLTLLSWYGVTLTPLARRLAGETGPPLTGRTLNSP
ncbi:hypothetical protein [Deinococcus sp.]|uniref:hypothetical protein n=1 Tax=Deinococcus sp. TaxID=47478 RepID=UPI0025C24963|nr:hypothetical protein [Deinococcus sp.]